uniref:Uncharacterized protein n=1 Tax=Lotharella oceanica TaxID=641309 RepID=A0A140GYS6_9EUKA|nr:hypothetical protein AN617_57 [Lotharella oceanica]AMN87098.1 hypothetical protein AN617_57 [Lotharella oceanica]
MGLWGFAYAFRRFSAKDRALEQQPCRLWRNKQQSAFSDPWTFLWLNPARPSIDPVFAKAVNTDNYNIVFRMNPNAYEHGGRILTDRKAFTGVVSSFIEQVLKLCPDTEEAMLGLYTDKHFPVLLTLGQFSYGENLGFEGAAFEYKNEVILFVPLNYSPSGSATRVGLQELRRGGWYPLSKAGIHREISQDL